MDSNDAYTRRGEWRRPGPAQPQMRVSDAERHEIADLLSKHFADGRLDDVEFNERLDKAMSAKTRADLAGLLDDLPAPTPPAPPPRARRRHAGRVVAVVIALIVLANAGTWAVRPHFAFFPLLVVLAIVVFARGGRGWRRYGGPAGN